MRAILEEVDLSAKLHKFSRAIRKFDIPYDVINILHDAEKRINQFEDDLGRHLRGKSRQQNLQQTFIEDDIAYDEELVPKAKPKWLPKGT